MSGMSAQWCASAAKWVLAATAETSVTGRVSRMVPWALQEAIDALR